MRVKCWLSIFLAALLSCSASAQGGSTDDADKLTWFLSAGNARGTVIILPGLNDKPETMFELADTLSRVGYNALVCAFAGQRPGEFFSEYSAEDFAAAWLADIDSAVSAAKTKFPELPLYNLSYSLGGAVTISYLERLPASPFKKLFFLAPAIRLNLRARALRLLLPFKIFNLSLPSLAPKQFRAHDYTSLRSYSALFGVIDSLQRSSFDAGKLNAIPAVIALSPEDELVSENGIKDWLKEKDLSSWKLISLRPNPQQKGIYKHQVFNEAGLGPEEWHRLLAMITETFSREE